MSLFKFIWCNRSTLWKNIPILEINYLKKLTEILLYNISLFPMIWTSGRAILSEDCPSVVLLAPSLAGVILEQIFKTKHTLLHC